MEFSRKYLSIFARSSVLYVRLGFQDVSDSRDYGTFKGPLSGLRQFLASPLKMIKNVSKLYLFSRCLNFCPDFFYVKNSFMKKTAKGNLCKKTAKGNFKSCDVTNWETNNYIIHIDQYLHKWRQSYNETNLVSL